MNAKWNLHVDKLYEFDAYLLLGSFYYGHSGVLLYLHKITWITETSTGNILTYKMRGLDWKNVILLNHAVEVNLTLKFLFNYIWTYLLGLNSLSY